MQQARQTCGYDKFSEVFVCIFSGICADFEVVRIYSQFARDEQDCLDFGNRNLYRLCGWSGFGIFNSIMLQVQKEVYKGGEEQFYENSGHSSSCQRG